MLKYHESEEYSAMFLYNNTITSESSLYVETEPKVNFVEESLSYNKELLTETMSATSHMFDIVAEYSDTPKAVTEAFSDWANKIGKFLKEFKAKVIVLFKRWIDWIAKKLHMKGLYSDEAVKTLLADTAKCSKLAGFKMELAEPTDFGFTYFNELENRVFIKNAHASAFAVEKDRVDYTSKRSVDLDVKKIRDELMNESKGFLNGLKKTEITIDDIRTLYDIKSKGAERIKKDKDEVIAEIDRLSKISNVIGRIDTDPVKDQQAYNAVITIVTCLNEHLTSMSNTYPTYINLVDKTFAEFLPQAEQYLIANG